MTAILEKKRPFRIDYKGMPLTVQEHTFGRTQVFHVVFPDATKSLTLCRAIGTERITSNSDCSNSHFFLFSNYR